MGAEHTPSRPVRKPETVPQQSADVGNITYSVRSLVVWGVLAVSMGGALSKKGLDYHERRLGLEPAIQSWHTAKSRRYRDQNGYHIRKMFEQLYNHQAEPEDIFVSSDEVHAFCVEESKWIGKILRGEERGNMPLYEYANMLDVYTGYGHVTYQEANIDVAVVTAAENTDIRK